MRRNSQARTTAYFVISAVASVLLINASGLPLVGYLRGWAQAAVLPLQVVSANGVGTVQAGIDTLASISTLHADNQRLKAEVAQLRHRLEQDSQAQAEDAELRRALDFKRQTNFHLLPAQVVGREPEGLLRSILVDRGKRDGLTEGMVVVNGSGLVGRVTQVNPVSSRVQLLIDSDARVNSEIVGSQRNGTVRGTGSGQLVMQLQPDSSLDPQHPTTDPRAGDQVLTSGLGGTYPRGLAVGVIQPFQRVDYAMVQSAVVNPVVDFDHLQVVLIITDFVPIR